MGSSREKFPLLQARQSGLFLFPFRYPSFSKGFRTYRILCLQFFPDFKVEMHEKAVNGARRKEDRGVQGGWRGGGREMARKRAGGKAASYHEHETTLNHKTSHRP